MPTNSQTYVRTLVAPNGPTATGKVRVRRDGIGYIIDSDAIVVYPGQGSVQATVSGEDTPSFVLYAYRSEAGTEASLPGFIDSRSDGWTDLTVNPGLNQAKGIGAAGNYQMWHAERTDDRDLTWRNFPPGPSAITFVPVPRYQFYKEIDGEYDYTVHLTCKDANARPVDCASSAAPGTRTEITPVQAGSGQRVRPESPYGAGGFFLDARGSTLAVLWRQETWMESQDIWGDWKIQRSTGWTMQGSIESDGPPIAGFEIVDNFSRFSYTMSPDGRRLEWRSVLDGHFPGNEEENAFIVKLDGHYADPIPRYDVRLTIDDAPAETDHIFVGPAQLESETDGSSFFVYPRP